MSTLRFGLNSGTYYLRVGGGYWGGACTQPFNFKIGYISNENWETALNSDFKSADTISLNRVVYGNSIGKDDYFKFFIPNTINVKINFKHDYEEPNGSMAGNDYGLTLYDSDYKEINTTYIDSTKCNVTTNNKILKRGTYFLRVGGGYWGGKASKEYNFKINCFYNVIYKLNGGTNNKNNPSSYYGKTIKLANPTRKGYTFSGWYNDSKLKTKITKIAKGSTGNKTLYATNGVQGYQIQYSTNKKFRKAITKTIKGKSAIYKVTKGKTYYVRVRAYKLDSKKNKVYGKWSTVKTIRIKK